MKNIYLTILLLTTYFTFSQDIKATTEDGKKIILKSNKTWEYDESIVENKNTCVIESHFKEPKYNKSNSWKRMGSTVDDLKKQISVEMEVDNDKIILLNVSEQLGNGVYILCVDGEKMKWKRTGSVFRKDGDNF